MNLERLSSIQLHFFIQINHYSISSINDEITYPVPKQRHLEVWEWVINSTPTPPPPLYQACDYLSILVICVRKRVNGIKYVIIFMWPSYNYRQDMEDFYILYNFYIKIQDLRYFLCIREWISVYGYLKRYRIVPQVCEQTMWELTHPRSRLALFQKPVVVS